MVLKPSRTISEVKQLFEQAEDMLFQLGEDDQRQALSQHLIISLGQENPRGLENKSYGAYQNLDISPPTMSLGSVDMPSHHC